MPSSLADDFFTRIVNEGANAGNFIRGLVDPSNPTFEEEWLDFKANVANDKDLKEIWSKALCAFANTQGGVLLWGIDAREDKVTKVDAASGHAPVPDPAALKSRLLQLHHQATDPPVNGVRIETYPDPQSAGSEGYVVCFIPESTNKPHRAELITNKPYYIRAGDDFVITSPSLLRLLFYPRRYSNLWIEVAPRPELFSTTSGNLLYEARLHNDGPASAEELFVVVQTDIPGKFLPTPGITNRANPQGQGAFLVEQTLHPGMSIQLCILEEQLGEGAIKKNLPRSPLKAVSSGYFRFLVYGRDLDPRVLRVDFTADDVAYTLIKRAGVES